MKTEFFQTGMKSPLGWIEIKGDRRSILEISFVSRRVQESRQAPAHLRSCKRQLADYFSGRRHSFSLPLRLEGSGFQKKVWRQLRRIPFGRTRSYGEIARAVGKAQAARAVGGANHRNPIGIVVPCHRVIGHNGKLVGYGGGLWRKRWLLQHERQVLASKEKK